MKRMESTPIPTDAKTRTDDSLYFRMAFIPTTKAASGTGKRLKSTKVEIVGVLLRAIMARLSRKDTNPVEDKGDFLA